MYEHGNRMSKYISGSQTLIECPLAELPPGMGWVMWCSPAVACYRCNASGLLACFKKLTGPDKGQYLCVECGSEGAPKRTVKRGSVEAEVTGPRRAKSMRRKMG